MKITIISGSPHKNGTSAALLTAFIRSAEEAGHEVYRFDAAYKDLHPCAACEHCHTTEDGCVFKDDMEELNLHLLDADYVVFASPIYFYGVNAQLKTAVDRFYAKLPFLKTLKKKAMLIITLGDDVDTPSESALAWFRNMIDYLGWENAGELVGVGLMDTKDLTKYDYEERAAAMGRLVQ